MGCVSMANATNLFSVKRVCVHPSRRRQSWTVDTGRVVCLLGIIGLLSGCASLPERTGVETSHAIPVGAESRLAQEALELQSAKTGAAADSGMLLLENGLDALVARGGWPSMRSAVSIYSITSIIRIPVATC